MADTTHFARALRRIRTSRHISQSEIARIVGVSQQAITSWEQGKGSPDPRVLCFIAAILDCSLEELLDMEGVLNSGPCRSTTVGGRHRGTRDNLI